MPATRVMAPVVMPIAAWIAGTWGAAVSDPPPGFRLYRSVICFAVLFARERRRARGRPVRHTHFLATSSLLAAISGAAGQSFTSDSAITFSLRWAEHAGNNNGVIEPGESVYFALDVSFTNQNGVANFSPPVATFGSGTIRGLGSGFIDLDGSPTSGNARGLWNVDQNAGYGLNPDWDVCGGDSCGGQSINGGADLINIQFAQFNATPASIMTTNPIITIWSGLWTPTSYDPRTVTFRPAGTAAGGASVASVALRLSETGVLSAFVVPGNLLYAAAAIPIVPAPSSLAIVAGALLATRRRRGEAAS